MLRNLLKTTTKNNYNKFASYKINNFHTTLQQKVEQEPVAIDSKHINRVNGVLGKYSAEEQEKILKIVNNYNLKELSGYEISKGRANKLLAWRMRNGLLKNLNDIFSIEGFGLKVTDKFYQSLLHEPKVVGNDMGKMVKVRSAPFITPSLEVEQQTRIKTCVSVRIGINSITWARLDVPTQDSKAPVLLTHWQHHEISERKLHLNELIQRCLYVHHIIPPADCYVFENPQMAQASSNPGSVEQQNINIQKAQVIAMMGYALASKNPLLKDYNAETEKKSQYYPSVFYLRRFLAARLFNHLVGTERVSSEQTILNMMRTYYNSEDADDFPMESEKPQQALGTDVSFSGYVQFPLEFRQMFAKAPPYCREFLGQSLLLNLTFVRLVLLQDAESISLVSRGNKNKTSNV